MLKRVSIFALCAALTLLMLASCGEEAPSGEPTPSLTPSAPSPSPELISTEDEDIYYEFMQSGEWRNDNTWYWDDEGSLVPEWLEISAYKIFDFDDDGVKELWLEAYEDGGYSRWGYSAFYSVENGQVKRLLYGHLSQGSIGGGWVVAYYDTQTEKHLLSLIGSFGGFGGRGSSGKYYEYENGELNEAFSIFSEWHPNRDYYDEEIEGLLHYVDEDDYDTVWHRVAIYEINDERVTKEAFEQMKERLIDPIDEKFILGAG